MSDLKRYYHIMFYFVYDKGDDWFGIAKNDSSAHYLVANSVLKPLIKQFEKDIPIWRFHRMYVEKDTEDFAAVNHFKFKFYTTKEVFRRISSLVKKHPLVKEMKGDKNLLLKIVYRESSDSNCRVGSDHDCTWTFEMKEMWPYYIHGLSKAWLKLVSDTYDKIIWEDYMEDEKLSVYELLEVYKKVRGSVKRNWMYYGHRCLIHHMNALFGYQWLWLDINKKNSYKFGVRRKGLKEKGWLKYVKLGQKRLRGFVNL